MMQATTGKFTAYRLANMADVSTPDNPESPGAQFLLVIQADYRERIEDGTFDEDTAHEIADGAVPVYYHDLFQALTDLAAYHEDVSDLGTPESVAQAAQWALYRVAERLVYELDAERNEETTR